MSTTDTGWKKKMNIGQQKPWYVFIQIMFEKVYFQLNETSFVPHFESLKIVGSKREHF